MTTSLRHKLSMLGLLAVFISTTGFGCKIATTAEKQLLQPIELTWWGVFDNPEDFNQIITSYKQIHPNITVNYRKLRFEEFDNAIIDALAEDRGPDIISVANSEVKKWASKLAPLPATTKMAYQTVQKSLGLKEETIIEVKTTTSITPGKLHDSFIDTVYDDAILDGQIYGLPLSVDTLALYYNRDLFNSAGIAVPPKTWAELQADIRQLTFQDSQGAISQSGVAIGTGANVDRAADIVSLLMMQNGAQMTKNGQISFQAVPQGLDSTRNPGPQAVQFYTDFASPTKAVYTWNATMPNSVDAFAQGKVAMMFGYNYHKPLIEAKRLGKLNYAIAPVPQLEGQTSINIANYWLYGVTKKSKHQNEAWDFIQFMTSADQAANYLKATNRPTALRSLVNSQIANDQIAVFASQLLTARNWYHGTDHTAVDTIFKDLITAVLTGMEPQKATSLAAAKVQQTL